MGIFDPGGELTTQYLLEGGGGIADWPLAQENENYVWFRLIGLPTMQFVVFKKEDISNVSGRARP